MKHIGLFRSALATLAVMFAVLPVMAENIKNLKPKYTSLMTVSGYAGESELENFPVAVRISPANISGFKYTQCDGQGDISFSDVDGNILPHEVELWNPEGESVAWVSIPKLSNGVTFIMNWAHTTKLADSKPQEVWTAAKYSAVWHMNLEDGKVRNSAGDNYGFSPSDAKKASDAKAGTAVKMEPGINDMSIIFSELKPFATGVGQGVVISGWSHWKGSKFSSSTAEYYVFEAYSSSTRQIRLRLYTVGTAKTNILKANYRTTAYDLEKKVTPSSGWFHWVVNCKPGANEKSNWTHDWYINGEKVYTASRDYDYFTTGTKYSMSVSGTDDRTDECRVRLVAANSADWIKAEYDSINDKQFIVASAAVANSSSGLSVFVR